MMPIFITVLFSIVSILYVVTLIYLQQNKGISITTAVLWLIAYSGVLIGIFLGIPAEYEKGISETQEDYKKYKDEPTIADKLKQKWVDAVSSKNKYFISWFIALLYLPIMFHYIHRCSINPMMYTSLYTFFKTQFYFFNKERLSSSNPTTGVLNILKEIDKLKITYSTEEEKLLKVIRESIEKKQAIVLESDDINVLRKLRYHIENKKLFNRFSSSPLPKLSSMIPEVNYTFLYLINVLIISIVCFYTYIYNYDQSYFILPLFTCTLSVAIYYLQGS